MGQWRHVKGVKNPADFGTRRLSTEGLREFLWLNGPAWLQPDEEKWPNSTWNWKKLEFVKTQKWSILKSFTSWDPKFVQTRCLVRKNLSNPMFWHEGKASPKLFLGPTNVIALDSNGYKHLHGAGLANFEIFSFIVNICKFFILCCFSCSLKAKYPNFEVLRAT